MWKQSDINEAVKNNPEKFLKDIFLEISKNEWNSLKSKFSLSEKRNNYSTKVVENFDHLENLNIPPYLPKVFTEKGLYMLATILKSKRAVQTTLAIIETFAKIRELSSNIKDLTEIKDEKKKNVLLKKVAE